MHFLYTLVNLLINIYIFIIVLQVIVNWLIIFDVINVKNEQAQNLIKLLKRLTDPVYEPIKKYVPPIGGIDLTPLVVILGLELVRSLFWSLVY